MKQYLDLLENIIENGVCSDNRTKINTYSVFGTSLRHNLQEGFPLLTTKRMFFRGIVEELLFFLRGDTDTKILSDKGIRIWEGNTTREFLDSRGLTTYPEGEMGVGYSWQWTNWGGTYEPYISESSGVPGYEVHKEKDGINQVKELIKTIRTNPNDRRMVVSAWNVSDLDRMALPPCHMMWQCYVKEGKLSLLWMQRSVDVGLGLGFNIASYALLAHILANICDLEVGDLIFFGGDTHVYENHIPPLLSQLTRKPYKLPSLQIKKNLSSYEDILNLEYKDFELSNYQYHPSIKMNMAI
jgi:thymidylate synthase